MTNEEVKEIIDRAEDEYDRLKDRVHEQYHEIERLNNIINELEKYLDEDDWTSVNGVIATHLIKNKLQELKGVIKSEKVNL